MRTTFALNYYCRASKANKKGLAPVEVSLIVNGKRVYMNLPRKEFPEQFAKDIKKRTSDLNRYLDQVTSNINQIQTELLSRGIPVTAAHIKEYIQNGGIKTYTLEVMFSEYYKLLKERIGIDLNESTYEKYLRAREEFFRTFNKDLEADEITPDMISNYYAALNRQNKPSTTASKMTKLKTVWKYAFQSGKVKSFPFSTIRIRKPAPIIEYLTPAELRNIQDKEIDNERMNRIRDLFLFQANSGLSYADMAHLEPEDLQEHNGTYFIQKKRIKTGIEFTAVLLPRAVEIFEKYDGKLPIISNQKMNIYLKELGTICNIKKNITSHLGRKTYATRMLNSGIAITTVSKLLGHSNSNITQKHYAKLWDETLLEEVAEHIK